MASVNVTIRMDEEDKVKAEKLFSEYGLTLNDAFNLFIKQVIQEQRIPFQITKNTEIEYVDKELFDKTVKESLEKHRKVYEELAK